MTVYPLFSKNGLAVIDAWVMIVMPGSIADSSLSQIAEATPCL